MEVEGEVVEDGPEDDAVDGGGEVCDGGGAVLEDAGADEGLRGEIFLVEDEAGYSEGADDEGDEGSPAVPGVLDAAPGDGDEEAGGGAEEEEHAEPVDATELDHEGTGPVVEV